MLREAAVTISHWVQFPGIPRGPRGHAAAGVCARGSRSIVPYDREQFSGRRDSGPFY